MPSSEEGLLCGKEATKILAFYRAEGFDLPLESNLFPDHFAIELEFMGLLCKREAEAFASKEQNLANTLRERQVEFMADHLGKWYKSFINTLQSNTESPFYKGMFYIKWEISLLIMQYKSASINLPSAL